MPNMLISNSHNFCSKKNFETGFEIRSVGILDISPYTKSEQPRIAEKHLTRRAKNGNSVTRIYSNTLQLSAFLLRGRGGVRFRGRWIKLVKSISKSC